MQEEELSKLIITGNIHVSSRYSFEKKGAKMVDRPNWSILYKSTGETLYVCNGKKYHSNADTIIVAPKGCDYEWFLIEKGYFSYISFDSELTGDELYSFRVTQAEPYLEIFRRMEALLQRREGCWQLTAMAEIYTMLNSLLTGAARGYLPRSRQDALLPAVSYISAHLSEPMTNDQLAALTGFSTSYFRRLFCETYQMSPMAYVQQLRVAKARELLRSGFGSISSVALSLGYANIYDFSRAFKTQTGMSPTAYLRQQR